VAQEGLVPLKEISTRGRLDFQHRHFWHIPERPVELQATPVSGTPDVLPPRARS